MNNTNWNLSQLFKSTSLKEEQSKIPALVKTIVELKGHISDNKETLLQYLKTSEKLSTIIGIIGCFLGNQENSDLRNTDYSKQSLEFSQFIEPYNVQLSFVTNEILNNCEKILDIVKKNDELKIYTFYFEDILDSKKHKISDEEEELITTLSPILGTAGEVFSLLTDADFLFDDILDENNKSIKLTQGNAALYLRNESITLRQNAYLSFWKSYFNHKNTLSTSYYQNIKATSLLSKIYKFNSSLDSALFSDKVDRKFYENLLTEVKNNNHLIIKWKNILAKITKVDNPKPWDWSGPLFVEQNVKIFTKEEAKTIVYEALSILGEDYKTKLDTIFNSELISWDPTEGKRSGAYSYGVWNAKPFILLNWNGKYVDLSTLIHEIGHSIHSMYSNENQPFIYHDYPIFLAEVASIFNEIILINYFIKNTKEKEFKKIILENAIKEFVALIWRQSQFAEFELEVHDKVDKNEAISLQDFQNIASNIYSKYFPKLKTESYKDDYQSLWGLYVPHFYSDFYVYKYVTGAIAACSLANKVLSGNKKDVEEYLQFLKSGSSMHPIDTLKKAGVDLNSKAGYDHAFKTFDNFLNELEKLID